MPSTSTSSTDKKNAKMVRLNAMSGIWTPTSSLVWCKFIITLSFRLCIKKKLLLLLVCHTRCLLIITTDARLLNTHSQIQGLVRKYK
jgi:hypothetical protein